jgi:coenzyme F420-0:L-glutamate ligase/coenzyme F420-1:gamma-L-glutamate ligase
MSLDCCRRYDGRVPISADIAAFVVAQRVACLATVDGRGRPHVVPVCFALAGGTVYSAVDEKPKSGDPRRLRRLRNIAANPHVTLLFDLYEDDDWSRLRYVQLRGRARIIEPGGAEHALAVAALRDRYPPYRTMAIDRLPVIAVDVDRVVAWRAVE